MTRYLLLATALLTGFYATASWICGLLTDAGIAAAVSAAAVLVAEFAAYCQRRRWRAGRQQVWERREAPRYTLDDVQAMRGLFWDERKPIETFMTYDRRGEPISGYDSLGHSGVWPFEIGAPE
jgi:hypothetical protein